jgi:hypothetical protein
MPPRRQPETNGCYQAQRSNNGGLIMWDIIFALIYHRSRRKYLAGMRMQQQLWT